MYTIDIHQRINQIIVIFRLFGMWGHEDEAAWRQICWKLMYLIFFLSFTIATALTSFLSDDKNERIFLLSVTIVTAIATVKLIYILWKKEEILALLHDIGVHFVKEHEEFTQYNKQVNRFMKFGSCFMAVIFADLLFFTICLPLFSREKILPLNVAFPLDWKNSVISYCIAYAFVTAGLVIAVVAILLNIVIWYLMMNCSIKYQILGNQLKETGSMSTTEPEHQSMVVTNVKTRKLFSNQLIGLIKVHQNIQSTIDRFKSCFADLFFGQITTSGICICSAIYVLAFSSNGGFIQKAIYICALVYCFFDIFMVMYFGNEIKLSSGRLSYCLFESNWIDQSKSCKRCIIILSEVLKQPHQLLIGKLYPLDLETFIGILNLVYSMFNILRNFN